MHIRLCLGNTISMLEVSYLLYIKLIAISIVELLITGISLMTPKYSQIVLYNNMAKYQLYFINDSFERKESCFSRCRTSVSRYRFSLRMDRRRSQSATSCERLNESFSKLAKLGPSNLGSSSVLDHSTLSVPLHFTAFYGWTQERKRVP